MRCSPLLPLGRSWMCGSCPSPLCPLRPGNFLDRDGAAGLCIICLQDAAGRHVQGEQLQTTYHHTSSIDRVLLPQLYAGLLLNWRQILLGSCSLLFPSQNLQVPSHLPLPVGTPKPPPQLLHPTNRGRSCDPRLSAASLPRAHQGTVAFTAHIQNSTNHRHKPHCQKDHT